MDLSFKNNPYQKFIVFLTIGLVASGVGIYFRLYPLLNYTSNSSTEKATLLVLSNLRKTVKASVENRYSQRPIPEKNRLVQKNFNALLRLESDKVRNTIHRLAKDIDAKQTLTPQTPYLLASDSYNYYNLTEEIQKTGTISPTVRGSKYLNPLMMAPLGHWEPLTLHPFVGYGLHKVISFFSPNKSLMYTVSYTPLIIMTLTVIAFLVVCSLLRCSAGASFVGALYLVLAPIYLKRSAFGWYDNDPYNVLFPLIILAVLFYGLTKKQSTKAILFWGFLCSFLISLYALFWQGWVFFETSLIISGIAIILFNHFFLKQKNDSKNLLIYFSVIPLGTFLGISLLLGIHEFLVLFQEGGAALKNFLSPQLSVWPDLYISVGELRRASLPFIIDLTGGYLFFMIALLGLLTYLLKAVRAPDQENPFPVFVLAPLLLFSIIITLGAERFALLCLIPSSILFTLGVQQFYHLVKILMKKFIRVQRRQQISRNILLTCLSVGLILIPIQGSRKKMPTLLNQIFNDTWQEALVKIKEQTPSDSIINTWWPPGHFIKAIANRKVTFDGATINVPQAYWISNMFINQNEKDALGILRMLNNSANKAAEYLQNQGFKLSEAVDILKTILPLSKEDAREKLTRVLPKDQTAHLLELTHHTPRPSYILIYNEFAEKSIELNFIGNWDFKKVEEINADPKLRREIPSSNSKEYIPFLWSLSGGQPRYSEIFIPLFVSDEEIIFGQNIKVDLKQMLCTIDSKKFGRGVPFSLLYAEDNRLVEKKFPNSNLSYSIILFKKKNNYNCILLEPDLAKSLFVRLFYFEGQGLKYIEPFIHEENLTRRTQILVYKINWEKFLKDL